MRYCVNAFSTAALSISPASASACSAWTTTDCASMWK
jgi:hypothetical protein